MLTSLALSASLLLAAPQSIKLNGPLARGSSSSVGGDVKSLVLSADGSWVAYLADHTVDELDELYSAPFDGSASARKLSALHEVSSGYKFAAGSSRVIYVDVIDASDAYQIRSAPIDGSSPALRLNPDLPVASDVNERFLVSPDGTRVVYLADQAVQETFELWSVPSDGSAPAVRLNGAFSGDADVLVPATLADATFQLTPDGARVLYLADQDTDGATELFSAPIAGGTTFKLSGTLVAGGNVADFLISPDGQWVVYRADQAAFERFELYAVPVGGGVPPVKLNGVLTSGGDIRGGGYVIASTSDRIAYLADQEVDERFEAFSVAIDGSAAPVKLSGPMAAPRDVTELALAPGGQWAVYLSDQLVDERFALFAVPMDASAAPVKLNYTLPAGGDVGSFWFSGDGARVVYWADQEVDAVDELYTVPVAGGVPPQKLGGPLVAGGDVLRDSVLVTPSGAVLFLADKLLDDKFDLWSAPVDASLAPLRLDANTHTFMDVTKVVTDATGERAGFLADAFLDNQLELLGVPSAGGAAPIRLSGAPFETPVLGDVISYAWAPDGRRVLYSADVVADEFWELFSVKLGPVRTPVRLNDPATSTAQSEPAFWFDPESERVVFHSRYAPPSPFISPDDDIFSVPRDGSELALFIGDDSEEGALASAFAVPGGVFLYGQMQASASPARTYHVWNAAIDGSRAPFELISPGPGTVSLVLAPQQDLVVCVVLSAGSYSLILVPVDGSAPGLVLTPPLAFVSNVRFSPAQDRVFFVGRFAAPDPDELWTVPVTGGTPQRLNPPLSSDRDVDSGFLVTPDGAHIVYRADQDADEVHELYSVPSLGGASVKLSGAMTSSGDVESFQFALSPDGARVVYLADQVTAGVNELFSAPVDGSAAAVRLNAPLSAGRRVELSSFHFAPDGQRVTYVANQDTAGSYELFLVRIDGSLAPVKLTPPMVAGGGVTSAGGIPLLAIRGQSAVYVADQDVNETFELYSVPLDGSQISLRRSGPMVANGDVYSFRSGAWGILYLADEERDQVYELFLALDVRSGDLLGEADSPLPATMVY